MGEPDFLKNPLERIAEILSIALNPDASPEARAAACEEIKYLPEDFLRRLALDSEWQYIQSLLEGEAVGELPGDGPWTLPDPLDSCNAELQTRDSRNIRNFETYTRDLQWLVRDDYLSPPHLIEQALVSDVSPNERIASCAAATPCPLTNPSADQIRRLAWSMLNHGEAILTIGQIWPNRLDLMEAFLRECLTQKVHQGVPPRLAARIESLIANRPDLQQWFGNVVAEIDEFLDAEILDFLSVDALIERHMDLRLGVAHAVRRSEITCAPLVAATELFATVSLLRACANRDVTRSWYEGKGDPQQAYYVYQRLNRYNDLVFARAFQAVVQKPTPTHLQNLGARDWSALGFSYEIQRRATRNDNAILLAFDSDGLD